MKKPPLMISTKFVKVNFGAFIFPQVAVAKFGTLQHT